MARNGSPLVRAATARVPDGAGATQRPGRLSVVDDIFLRTHRGLGTPIALQGLWRTADRVDPELLRQVHAALRVGPLGRRVIRPPVPGARRAWRPNTRAYPLEFTDDPIAGADLLRWADQQGADLDPEYGPGWRLSTAALDDGGSIVSLTCSHALADGRALVLAVDEALGGTGLTAPAVRSRPPSAKSAAPEPNRPGPVFDRATGQPTMTGPTAISNRSDAQSTTDSGHSTEPRVGCAPDGSTATDPLTTPQHSAKSAAAESDRLGSAHSGASLGRRAPASDWMDAWRQWSIVLRGIVRALRSGVPERPTTVSPREHTGVGTARTHSLVLQCPAADWELAAAAQGGTANSLFIALIAKMLWASGFTGDTIDASLPIDTRDEPRVDNDLAMTEIAIDRSDTPATIREKSRIAYERHMSSPGGMPEELLQVLPDRWAYALSEGAGERDILCSNIGDLPDSLRTLGPHRCTGVATRAIHPGLTTDRLPRTRLSGYLCRIADTYTLAIVSLDPDHVDTPETLRSLVHKTTADLSLPVTLW
ncbi:hypothetical protein OG874_30020 [Nocardia sp. NBC_00565]|uniref:hypothetical protein n=1 Tax=Nocardia sp. NBC_00565 TaxID=2975993 RepID=UPI002E81C795|nr:hypothetical protein [Nocardia sp. NBC_00565]WUC01041.1 hypothetical protein OG874_30020 [Nocardia sp. NBC_00565]